MVRPPSRSTLLPNLPDAPRGIGVLREPGGVHLSMPQPGRSWVSLRLALVAVFALAALVTALRIHSGGTMARQTLYGFEFFAALVVAAAAPLSVAAAVRRREVVLTEGVLLLREGRSDMGDCLRESMRAVRLVPEQRDRVRIELEAEVSPRKARVMLGPSGELDENEDVVVLLTLPHSPRPEAEFIATAIASWADIELERESQARPVDGSAIA